MAEDVKAVTVTPGAWTKEDKERYNGLLRKAATIRKQAKRQALRTYFKLI